MPLPEAVRYRGVGKSGIIQSDRALWMKLKRIRRQLVASVLLAHENQGEDKHVESILFPRLDTGSTPVSSTTTKN